MKQNISVHLNQMSKSSLCFLFAFILTCVTANPIFAEHDHMETPEGHSHAEHHEDDDHDHDHEMANKYHQCNMEGIALYRAKDYKAAVEKFEQAIAENPNIGETYGMLGKAQAELGEFEAAIINLKTSLKLTKNENVNRLTHKYLARGYIGLGKYAEAKKEIDLYKEMCTAQNALTPKTEKIINDLYDLLK